MITRLIRKTYDRNNSYIKRFLNRFTIDLHTGCWNWWAGTFRNGYSRFWAPSLDKSGIAYRVGYVLYKGRIPKGLELHHICENIKCVNPDHLLPVTKQVHFMEFTNSYPRQNKQKTHCPLGHVYVTGLGVHNSPRRCKDYQKRWHRRAMIDFRNGVLDTEYSVKASS